MAEEREDFDQAINFCKQALEIDEKNYKDNHEHKAEIIKKIGILYIKKGDTDTALDHIFRALEMFQHILPPQHPHIAMCLRNIGQAYLKKGDCDIALDYFRQKLEMDQECLPSDHYYLFGDLDLIVTTYIKARRIDGALEFCRERLDRENNTLYKNHSRIAQTLMITAKVLTFKNLDKALEYYEEALSVLEQSTVADRKTIDHCVVSMDRLYSKYHVSNDTLTRFLKAFDLFHRILPSDHISIANICNNIALRYEFMNNPMEALYYFNKSFSIYRATYDPTHPKVKSVEIKIAKLKKKQKTTRNIKPSHKNVNEE